MTLRTILSRRAALLGLTTSGALATTPRRGTAAEASPAAGGVCRLTPQSIEGPFYVDPRLIRADIRADRPGLPLRLRLRVIEAGPCTPIRDARVDVWHADAQGLYSGYEGQGDRRKVSTVGQTFLRGTQHCDADGWVSFETIYPGWYTGRATHVHFKVFVDARTLVTGQMYFPEDVNTAVYRDGGAYANRIARRSVTNANDDIFLAEDPQKQGLCTVDSASGTAVASLVVGVDRRGAARAPWSPQRG